jgi:hypothetical protein
VRRQTTLWDPKESICQYPLPRSHRYHQCLIGSSYSHVPSVSSHAGSWVGSGSGLGKWDQCGGKGGSCYSFQCLDGPYPSNQCPDGGGRPTLTQLP